jgi:hypothetical protein
MRVDWVGLDGRVCVCIWSGSGLLLGRFDEVLSVPRGLSRRATSIKCTVSTQRTCLCASQVAIGSMMEGIAQASIRKADRVSSMCMQDSEIINRGFSAHEQHIAAPRPAQAE